MFHWREGSTASSTAAVLLLLLSAPVLALTTMVQETRLDDDQIAGRYFGTSPEIDDDTLVVGELVYADHGDAFPAAVVFTRTNGTWERRARIVVTDFGRTFYKALVTRTSYADGVLVIAAYSSEGKAAAYVYEGGGADWTRTATLLPDAVDEYFGEGVDTDGRTILVGSRSSSYLYGRSGSNWLHQVTLPGLIAGSVQDDVAILADGPALALFEPVGGTWSRSATLSLGSGVVGISDIAWDGQTLMATGSRGFQAPSSLHAFTRSGAGWRSAAEIPFAGSATQLALSGDTAIVVEHGAGPVEVQIHLITRRGGVWQPERRFEPPDPFGPGPALDGDTAVLSVPSAIALEGNRWAGATYVYRIRQGIGQGVDLYCAADVDGDGSRDVTAVTAQHEVSVRRLDESLVSQFILEKVGVLRRSTLVPDSNTNGAPELATVVQDVPFHFDSPGPAQGEIRDLQNGALLTELSYTLNEQPAAVIAALSDSSGNGMPEVAVAGRRFGQIELHDSLSAETVRDITFSRLLVPVTMGLFPDLDGNRRRELAVLGENITTGNNDLLELRDPVTGSVTQQIWLDFGWEQLDHALVRDLNGNGSDEVAVLRTHPDGRVNVQVRDLATRAWLHSIDFTPGYRAQALVAVSDVNGNGADELVVFGPRNDGFNQKAIMRDSSTGAWLRDMFFDRNFPGQDFASCGDLDGNGGDDIALLGYDPVNGRNKVIIKDTATGQRLAQVRFW